MKRRVLSTIIALLLVAALLPMSVLAASYTDTDGHWAKSSIERWSDAGVVQGAGDAFAPDSDLTCAQLATILAKLLRLPAADDAGFGDNLADAWYYDAINRCAAAGILNGYADGTVRPNETISRARAMVMLARALGIEPAGTSVLNGYADAANVPDWARGYVAALLRADIVSGVSGSRLAALADITRAQFVTILDRAIAIYADEDGATVKADDVDGIIVVVAEDVQIKDAPAGTKVVAAASAKSLKVNGKSVDANDIHIVPETVERPKSVGHAHSHSYDATTHKCSCGAFDPAVVATVNDSVGYLTFAAAVAAAETSDTVKLLQDVTLTERIDTEFSGTIDLGGHTVTSTATCKNGSVFNVKSGELTIKNGIMIGVAGPTGWTSELYEMECDAITVYGGAVVDLEDLTISICSRTGACVYAFDGATVNVKSGTYSNSTEEFDANGTTKAMLLNQADGRPQAIFVSGGTFRGENPANGDNSHNPATFLAPGYQSTEGNGAWVVTSLFAGGYGTEEDPFLINTAEQFASIADLFPVHGDGTPYYFRQTGDLTVDSAIPRFAGEYDGGGYKISSSLRYKGNYVALFTDLVGHARFCNMDVQMDNTAISVLLTADWGTGWGADFENLTFTAQEHIFLGSNVTNFGFAVINALYTDDAESVTYNFVNITNNVSVENMAACVGAFIGSGPCFNAPTTLNFVNCTNNGNLTSATFAGFLYGNPTYIDASNANDIHIENCKNNATIRVAKDTSEGGIAALAPRLDTLNEQYQETVGGSYVTGNCLKDAAVTVTQNADASAFVLTTNAEEGYTYKLVLSVNDTFFTADGTPWTEDDLPARDHFGTRFELSNSKKYPIEFSTDNSATQALNTFHALDKRSAEAQGFNVDALGFDPADLDTFVLVVRDGVNYIILNTAASTYVDSGVVVEVYAYDANGSFVGTKRI